MKDAVRRRLLAVASMLGLAVAFAVPAGAAQAVAPVVYSVSYSSTLYVWDAERGRYSGLSYLEWSDLGFPAPTRAATDFVKYPWSNQVYAVTYFDADSDLWLWEHLDYAAWSRAGRPSPRTAGWIAGSWYHKFAYYDEMFVELDGEFHKLTYAEWAASGFQQPDVLTNEMVVKLTWHPTIAHYLDLTNRIGYPLTYADWQALAFPKPAVSNMLPGDAVCMKADGTTLYYVGMTYEGPLTYEQWGKAGYPAPEWSC